MNQQTGAAVALLNIYLLTGEKKFLESSRDKIELLNKRQSEEGWLVEYGGPDIGYLSLAIDYLCKYYKKSEDDLVKGIITRAVSFIKYFIQPGLFAGGEYASRNTEYLIPHGFELFSRVNDDARFAASVIRKSLLDMNSFPNVFDDRYLTYVGYTWLQAYLDANPEIDDTAESLIEAQFNNSFEKYFPEAGLLVINDERKHFIVNMKKGGAFRLFDKKTERSYSDSGILVQSDGKWHTSGWLSKEEGSRDGDTLSVKGNMWKVPDKALTTFSNILLRLFQATFGRSTYISLWLKERLRDVLITKTEPSAIRYCRKMVLKAGSDDLIHIEDSVTSDRETISSMAVFAKDSPIYVPSSRYYVNKKDKCYREDFPVPVGSYSMNWKITKGSGAELSKSK